MRVYDMDTVLRAKDEKVPCNHEILGSKDYMFTDALWGPLNKTLIVSTSHGHIMIYDLSKKKFI